MEFPLSAEEMVAALYGVVEPQDIAADETCAAASQSRCRTKSLTALSTRSARIWRDEQDGASPAASSDAIQPSSSAKQFLDSANPRPRQPHTLASGSFSCDPVVRQPGP